MVFGIGGYCFQSSYHHPAPAEATAQVRRHRALCRTTSRYIFNRFVDQEDIVEFGPLSPDTCVRHAGPSRDTGACLPPEVRLMAFHSALEAARRNWSRRQFKKYSTACAPAPHSIHPVREGRTKSSGPPSLSRPPVRPFIVAPKLVAPPPRRPPRVGENKYSDRRPARRRRAMHTVQRSASLSRSANSITTWLQRRSGSISPAFTSSMIFVAMTSVMASSGRPSSCSTSRAF
jgi:hypothetical protein